MSIKTISTYESIVKGTDQKKKSLIFDFKKTYSAYIVLILTIIASFIVMRFVESSIESDQKLAFEKASNSINSRIDKHNLDIMHVQNSMQNLFEKTFVVKSVFELNGLNLVQTYESLIGMNYVYQVYPSQMPEFIHATRSQGYYDMSIHPKAERKEYYIVEYVVPFIGNEDRSGFDYASDDIALEYIKKSAELDSTLVTPIYKFRDDIEGFQIITAIFKDGENRVTLDQGIETNQGTLILEIDSKKFFIEALGEGNASDSTVFFTIKDPSDNSKLVYATANTPTDEKLKPVVEETELINIAGKDFELYLATVPNFGGSTQEALPLISFAVVLIIGIMLFAFLVSVITSRERAQEIADRLTLSQRRIFDTSNDIIGILDLEGVWKTVNNAILPIMGIDSDVVIGTHLNTYYKNEIDRKELVATIAETQKETAFNQTALMKVNEIEKWIDWNFSISKADGLIYAIGRDVTLEKEAEKQSKIKSRQRNLAEHYAKEANISKSFLIRDISDKLINILDDNQDNLQKLNESKIEFSDDSEKLLVKVEENSNIVYNIVESMKENTIMSDKSNDYRIEKVNFLSKLNKALDETKKLYSDNKLEIITEWNQLKDLFVYANDAALTETFDQLFRTLVTNQNNVEINIQIEKNNFENVMELEILCSNNIELSTIVEKFKTNRNNIFDIISSEDEDYIYNIALIESDFKRMNGNTTIETLEKDETLFIITIPLNV
ncbi:MAG: CHASE domain-containing protein [Candidatus Kapaibacterium sp.]